MLEMYVHRITTLVNTTTCILRFIPFIIQFDLLDRKEKTRLQDNGCVTIYCTYNLKHLLNHPKPVS